MSHAKETPVQRLERLKSIVLAMPEKPGSYQFYDADGTIIYVGKAKRLKSRVSSYFHKEVDRFKTKVLVSKIQDISYTVVNSEEAALLLENSLIKKYNPRYNVLLKDGKTYPSIVVTNEPFPRIFTTRKIVKGFGQYFGPYSHLGSMYTVLELIKKLYHPRMCRFPLTKENVFSGKYRPCLEYHIKNCGAPCIGRQSQEEYLENISRAKEILKGNTRILSSLIYDEMMKLAEQMRFEEAEELKKKYLLIDQYCAKTEIVSNTITDVDVFTISSPITSPLQPPRGEAYSDTSETITNIDNTPQNISQKASPRGGLEGADLCFVNYMHVKNGTINQSFTYEYKRLLEESDEELLLSAIIEIRERFQSTAKEIIVPFEMEWEMENASFFVPQRGDKKHLLELSQMNTRQYRFDRLKQQDKLNPEQKYTRMMMELKDKLGLEKLPFHIELFDNSNISGTDAVAGCVVYKGMKKSKQDYRKYNIKTVEGPDDYASMQEVVLRRYSPLQPPRGEASAETSETLTREGLEGAPLPDLIICDGGLGQMHAVAEVVWEKLKLKIHIAGLAKNDKHRTQELLYLEPVWKKEHSQKASPRGGLEGASTIQLKPDSELFRILTQMQDEVHRYAITFHRDKRSKHALHSELDDIKGIGPKAKEDLLAAFKSVKRVREATTTEEGIKALTDAVGASKTAILTDYFNIKQ